VTAEIVVMNRTAVAMAADSAATLRLGQGQKIFNTVNKLFSLSKSHPVGIMVYGDATIMGLPWETVIKVYRRELGQRSFSKLQEFAEDFVKYLDGNDRLATPETQEVVFLASVENYYRAVVEEIRGRVSQELVGANVPPERVSAIVGETINRHLQEWEASATLPHLPVEFPTKVLDAHGGKIRESLTRVFQNLPLDTDCQSKLAVIAVDIATRARFHDASSGLVVAGFGDDDLLPAVRSILVEGIVQGRLKYRWDQSADITLQNGACIIPFAQKEMVQLFIEGVHPASAKIFEGHLRTFLHGLPAALIPDPVSPEMSELRSRLEEAGPKLLDQLIRLLADHGRQNYVQPLLDTVGSLPKEELAAMAETLVNLTSFKRRMSAEPETVGGPIDVAVISKGDGFVWIRRKHYFHADLNPQFFANYNREHEDQDGSGRKKRR
jgi:hypothetical protein